MDAPFALAATATASGDEGAGSAGAGADAEPAKDAATALVQSEAAQSSEAADSPSLLSLRGIWREVERLSRELREIPEDAADEGRFLLMAAFVGVLTGTSGELPCVFGHSLIGLAASFHATCAPFKLR